MPSGGGRVRCDLGAPRDPAGLAKKYLDDPVDCRALRSRASADVPPQDTSTFAAGPLQ